ncbi:MAG: hypothetical protein LBP87_14945 [Planctomycetaceae bacterium]|nr:hypothetical protein [Planctomycetaceae bacterium]
MHNRRCSEAEPTDRQIPNPNFKPRMGRDYQPNNYNLALAGLCPVLSRLSVGCASLHLRLCTSHPLRG